MNDPLLKWRDEFPILANTVYMISNSLGAMPRGVFDAMRAYADKWATRGVRAWNEGWWEMPVDIGNLVAQVIGAPANSVTMHQNVTIASAVVLSCLDFPPTRNKVVMTDMDFPSVLYVHKKILPREVDLCVVQSDDGISIAPEKMLSAIDERTRLVAVSHVLFKSAFIQDAAAIVKKAHSVGAMVCLDAFHSGGVVPLNVTALDVDLVVGGVLKWLCGGPGGAFLYVRPDLARTLEPRFTGWMAHAHPFAFETEMEYADTIARFLNGTPQVPCLYAAKPGLEMINTIGVDAIRAKSKRQTARIIELAEEYGFAVSAPRHPDQRGGTVAVNVGEHSHAVSLELKRREFLVDFRVGAGIRISPHFYSKDEELDLIMREIRTILDTRAYESHLTAKSHMVT
ncbi:kynureninase [Anaerolineae bacterium]|nr:kynureninase [Anaerolineae bacterium]